MIEERGIQTNSEYLAVQAVSHLNDIGVLDPNSRRLRITAIGWEYWEKINTPKLVYWFRKNAFPTIVAAATILASVGGIVVNALD